MTAAITGKKGIAMNYRNYQTAIICAWGVKLVGWPNGVQFVNPSHLGTVADLRRIRDALRDKSCYWKALTASESKAHKEELQARAAAGDAIQVPRKQRSDFGRKRKVIPGQGSPAADQERPAKRARKTPAPKSAEYVLESDVE